MGSTTTQGRPATRVSAAGRVAFRSGYGVGALITNFRSSIPSPSFPLFTLHWRPHGVQCKTRGRADRYSFLVRLFHPQLHAGLSRRTPTIFSDEPKNIYPFPSAISRYPAPELYSPPATLSASTALPARALFIYGHSQTNRSESPQFAKKHRPPHDRRQSRLFHE